ncbi:Hypothetical protein CINCED_3A004918 [Cinara cedri]|uniref:Uncharacterized protein n=1 Tax=Cinara cedri TaxID=506608 RepID=A0A5E4NCB7_9HEMI|nr:Hypothetical protein CINCED_3A004918 [Cinara cedri]
MTRSISILGQIASTSSTADLSLVNKPLRIESVSLQVPSLMKLGDKNFYTKTDDKAICTQV